MPCLPFPNAHRVRSASAPLLLRPCGPQQDWEVQQRRTAKIEDEEFDRGFYLRDDGGGAVEDSEAANPFLGDEKKFAAKEAENAKLR